MKRYIFLVFIVGIHFANGQKRFPFIVSGTVNADTGIIKFIPTAIITDYPDYFNFLPTPVIQGKFKLTGFLEAPVKVRLYYMVGQAVYVSDGFYLDSGLQSITWTLHPGGYHREIPSIHNKTMDGYNATFISPEYKSLDTVSDYYQHRTLSRQYIKNYARQHSDADISLWELGAKLEQGYDPAMDSGYSYLSSRLQHSYSGRQLHEDFIHLRLTAVGKSFPSLTCFDSSGAVTEFFSSIRKTRYTLVDFWFSHCGPCIGQFPEYSKIVDSFSNKGFSLVGVSADTSKTDIAAWKKVMVDHSLKWKQVRLSKSSVENLRLNSFPTNVLIDNRGMIIAKDMDTKQLADFLNQQFR